MLKKYFKERCNDKQKTGVNERTNEKSLEGQKSVYGGTK
jgi:hypothetical protein